MKPDVSTQPALDPRTDPPPRGSERQTLIGFLDYQRRTLQMKCAGLSATALGTRAVPPSGLSLLGLVRHLSDVERFWVRSCLAGKQAPPLYWGKDGTETDFDFPAPDAQLVELSFAAWKEGWPMPMLPSAPHRWNVQWRPGTTARYRYAGSSPT